MEEVNGVIDVHDLHVWSLGSQSRALACHVKIDDIPPSASACILADLNHVLRDHFHISHSTIQFEHIGCGELVRCVVPPEQMAGTQRAFPPRSRTLTFLEVPDCPELVFGVSSHS